MLVSNGRRSIGGAGVQIQIRYVTRFNMGVGLGWGGVGWGWVVIEAKPKPSPNAIFQIAELQNCPQKNAEKNEVLTHKEGFIVTS
ncbi:hypothetical protein LXL04_018063 [Taraxacum kok-saghyz]